MNRSSKLNGTYRKVEHILQIEIIWLQWSRKNLTLSEEKRVYGFLETEKSFFHKENQVFPSVPRGYSCHWRKWNISISYLWQSLSFYISRGRILPEPLHISFLNCRHIHTRVALSCTNEQYTCKFDHNSSRVSSSCSCYWSPQTDVLMHLIFMYFSNLLYVKNMECFCEADMLNGSNAFMFWHCSS